MADETYSPMTVNLIIRFPTSIPDLHLTIPTPHLTTAVILKQLIRPHLPPSLSNHRLRLIYSGKVLPDPNTLTASLRLPPPRPSPTGITAKAKGKTPIYPPQTLYIHCSIADPLSESELAAEIRLATSSSPLRPPETDRNVTPLGAEEREGGGEGDETSTPITTNTTTTPNPRGFDRLLSAGLTPTEIASLRSQFLAIQAHTHTPDTMPSASELRTLEDRWIDSTANGGGGGVDGFDGGGGLAGDGADAEDGALDDMLWGNVLGFFWPMGAVCWLLREEGVWTRRRQIAVVTGVLVNIAFSVLRFS
ncbi:hypothetical protein MMC14_002862 [Varicellaria rhodocarpa]|nr:hypothetical protein [Varicellaria rhodocarpa]